MTAAAIAATGISVTSCDIDLLPLNEVVYENFWTNKDDVESVVASCYDGMRSADYQKRVIVWVSSEVTTLLPVPMSMMMAMPAIS